MSDGSLDVQVKDGIGRLTFGHAKGNSLPGKLLRMLADAIQKLSQDRNAQVLVLQSEGERAFCAGASFDELLHVRSLEESRYFFEGFALVLNAMRRCPKFIVARVQGKAVGGGVGLIAASDYAIAVQSTSVRLSELALGFGPFVIGPAVERRLGPAAFAALAIDTEWRDAEWCFAHGLIDTVVQSHAELDEAVQKLAATLAKRSPDAMARLKGVLWEGTEDWDSLLTRRFGTTAELALTEFAQNCVRNASK